ncbi:MULTISPECIES: monovalent cation/H(+) antiporter subunit G [Halococcus]|uniref:monovalent cation/H(+) antiporter subunit G n=1 Tax=Halococcus TaxID=2249 RepID=UPI000E745D58|nr:MULTISPECIES: monovalent cation/H(+) antiporter subunit G [Halococcus]RJT06529.1 monovalent cation/H(+) antiporter subunit G [Halococcus sp. IIIV-5B]
MNTIHAAIVAVLIGIGCFFLVVGTLGLVRLPDVYNRMHATTKATTLGAASFFLAGVVYFGPAAPGGAGLIALVGLVFLFITAPTGAHVISQAAERMGVAFAGEATWPDTGESRPESPGEEDEG